MEYRCYYVGYHGRYSRQLYSDRDQCQRLYSYGQQDDHRHATAICSYIRQSRYLLWQQQYTHSIWRWHLPVEHGCYHSSYHRHYGSYLYRDRDQLWLYGHCEPGTDCECTPYSYYIRH